MSAFGEKADIELNIMRDILKVIFWQASAGARHFRHKSTRQLVPRGVGVAPNGAVTRANADRAGSGSPKYFCTSVRVSAAIRWSRSCNRCCASCGWTRQRLASINLVAIDLSRFAMHTPENVESLN